ncbi:MAG TPA: PLP-dependent aminotransferase family protein [Rhodospirillales bacterium]|nr:PLP-dependent aminotransferase family protein [Rhodospirillales bacterium]
MEFPVFDIRRAPHSYETTGVIDMSMNRPTTGRAGEDMARTLSEIAASRGVSVLTEYQPSQGMPAHREAGAKLLKTIGLDASPDDIIMTNGAQHAMAALFMALTSAGDLMLTEKLTYPAVKALARSMNLRLNGLAMDDQGLMPQAFEDACRKSHAKVLYTMPTLHNPTNAIQSEQRRRDIAAIAEHHGVAIIEDDVYGFLPGRRPPPLVSFAPEQGYFLTSTAKSIAPGLRVGYAVGPHRAAAKIGHSVQITGWMIPPLMGELTSRWINDGTAAELIAWHRHNAASRNGLARKIFDGLDFASHPESYHVWLSLPADLSGDELVRACLQKRIVVSQAESFALHGDPVPGKVRVCLGGTDTIAALEQGLKILRDIIDHPPAPDLSQF